MRSSRARWANKKHAAYAPAFVLAQPEDKKGEIQL